MRMFQNSAGVRLSTSERTDAGVPELGRSTSERTDAGACDTQELLTVIAVMVCHMVAVVGFQVFIGTYSLVLMKYSVSVPRVNVIGCARAALRPVASVAGDAGSEMLVPRPPRPEWLCVDSYSYMSRERLVSESARTE